MARAPFDTTRPVLQSFLAARLIVLAAYVAAVVVAALVHRRTESLLGWDADWYRRIADRGYTRIPAEGLRFFPLLPLLARALGTVVGAGAALLLLADASALAAAALGRQLALSAGYPERVARLVPWVVAFSPAAAVLAMGYGEAPYAVLVAVILLAVRSGRWWPAAAAGALAGGLRPTGVLLAVPVAVEAWQGLRSASTRERATRALAVLAPALGALAYLAWVGWRFGSVLLPFRVQTRPELRAGVLVNPLPSIGRALLALFGSGPGPVSPLPHLLWALLVVALLVRCARRLPLSWTAFSAVTVLLALTARGLTSFERYAGSALPLLLVAAEWLAQQSGHRRRQALAAAAVVLFGYSCLTFLHLYQP